VGAAAAAAVAAAAEESIPLHAGDRRENRRSAESAALPRLAVVPGFTGETPLEPEPFEELPSLAPLSGESEEGSAAPSAAADALRERLLAALTGEGKRFTAEAMEQADLALKPLPQGGFELLVRAPRETSLSLREVDLREALRTEQPPIQRIRLEFGKVTAASDVRPVRSPVEEQALRQTVQADPEIQRIQAMFHGTITRVRSLRE